jgi:glutamate/tyrosine decarboxylase-like PLP-dependent enzyme
MVLEGQLRNTTEVVDYLIHRFMRVPPGDEARQKLIAFLNQDLGTTEVSVARTYMEQSLRLVLHLMMSQPEYQLG